MSDSGAKNGDTSELRILEFKVDLAEVPFKITKGADTVEYTMRELDGAARDRYMNKQREKFQFNKEGDVTGVRDYTGLHSLLLSMCVYPKGTQKTVDEPTIQSWPVHVLEALFKLAQTTSHLSEEAKDNAKKPSEESVASGTA